MSDGSRHRFVVAFTGSGSAADAIAHVVSRLEEKGHDVELVSYGGLAAQAAKSWAERGYRGLKAAVRTVTGGLSGEDPLGFNNEEKSADVVVVTTPDLAQATRALSNDTLRVGLNCDLIWRPSWGDAAVDALVVPHPIFRELALRKGMPEEAVLEAGVPLSRPFSRKLDPEALREEFGITRDNGIPIIVLAEDMDEGRLDRLVFQLSLVDNQIQPIFYVGEDKFAGKVLRRAAGEYGVLARMFGVVDNLEEYYAACDLVIGEGTSPLILPMLALDKPLLLVDEDADTSAVGAFLSDEGAAVLVPDILRLGAEVDALLADEAELTRLREGAGRVVTQDGANRVADALIEAANRADEIRDAGSTPDEAEQDTPLSGGGAFEVIGGGSEPERDRGKSDPSTRKGEGGVRGGSTGERASRYESRLYSRISKAEAKEELAALIMMERDVEKRLATATQQVGQWEGRLDLARQAGEPELAAEAERILENGRREEAALLREIDRIRDQKAKLKRRAGAGGGSTSGAARRSGGSNMEGRFRSMELDRDLSRLKDRVKDDFGDE